MVLYKSSKQLFKKAEQPHVQLVCRTRPIVRSLRATPFVQRIKPFVLATKNKPRNERRKNHGKKTNGNKNNHYNKSERTVFKRTGRRTI